MAGFIGDTKYVGAEKIVVAMDIGTTHSAVSYAYLYPDDYVRARIVSKWPGAGSAKIPTLVAYHREECKACGPEAKDLLDERGYEVAKWFKLHLHPVTMRIPNVPPPYGDDPAHTGFEIPPLPQGKTLQAVYTDFMRYLMESTQNAFTNSIPNGAAIWNRLQDSMVIILTTPNGWDLIQQSVMRRAAISAGLVSSDKAQQLLEFVTEGEASVHYALAYSQSKAWLAKGSIFAVIDAGGSTVDSTLYRCTGTNPQVLLEEVCPSECVQAGGVFVDRAAEVVFKIRVQGSQFASDDCIADMVAAFEGRTKRLFDGTQASNVVDFGSNRDNDRKKGIIKGKLSLSLGEVSEIFDGVTERIGHSVVELFNGENVKYALLVGGFGESPYLQKRLAETFRKEGTLIVTAEEPTKKAAAYVFIDVRVPHLLSFISEGALIWFIKQTITSRISKSSFGTECNTYFVPEDLEHQRRATDRFRDLSGVYMISNAFNTAIPKGTRMSSDFTQRTSYKCLFKKMDGALSNFEAGISVWEGMGLTNWTTDTGGTRLAQMRRLCTLQADMTGLRNALRPLQGLNGKYYEVNFIVAIRFGGTQLQANIEWEENGVKREGPVTIIPNAII